MGNFGLGKMKKAAFQNMGGKAVIFWNRFFRLFLGMFFLGMMAWAGYIWYLNLYQGGWSEEEKNEFLNSQSNEMEFQRDLLGKVVRKIDASRAKFNQEILPAKNIFKAN